MTLLIAQIIAQIQSLQLFQGKLLCRAVILPVLEIIQVISKRIEAFWLMDYKDNNNMAVKRSTTTKMLEYQWLKIEKLL